MTFDIVFRLSRASSISSLTSEPAHGGFFSPLNLPPRQYVAPSDIESEVDEASGVQLGSVSKAQLYEVQFLLIFSGP